MLKGGIAFSVLSCEVNIYFYVGKNFDLSILIYFYSLFSHLFILIQLRNREIQNNFSVLIEIPMTSVSLKDLLNTSQETTIHLV